MKFGVLIPKYVYEQRYHPDRIFDISDINHPSYQINKNGNLMEIIRGRDTFWTSELISSDFEDHIIIPILAFGEKWAIIEGSLLKHRKYSGEISDINTYPSFEQTLDLVGFSFGSYLSTSSDYSFFSIGRIKIVSYQEEAIIKNIDAVKFLGNKRD